MKKNKNKKLKKKFKSLLHSHINKGTKERRHIESADLSDKPEKLTPKVSDSKNTSDIFASRDIIKTIIITTIIILSMGIISYFFNKNNLFDEVINFISKSL